LKRSTRVVKYFNSTTFNLFKGKKGPKKTARAKNGEARPGKPVEEPEIQKKTKTEMLKPLSSESKFLITSRLIFNRARSTAAFSF